MSTFIIDVRHMDRYELDGDSADEAIGVAKRCAVDNYGASYLDGATFDAIRISPPQAGDLTDAGMAGE
jgi:hypothetical protein|tara:strand:- start:291 stop:494 length:204 start_codon:yes stop_codon:yes gene_type:complete